MLFLSNDRNFIYWVYKIKVMNPILRNVLAVIAGIFIGGLVNMGLIVLSPTLIPPPAGVNPADPESLKANIHLFEAKHFVMPFLAHALGTLVGALVAALIAATHKMKMALIIGAFFLFGGIMMVLQVPSPMWFNIVDLVGAYFPMAWLGGKFGGAKQKKQLI